MAVLTWDGSGERFFETGIDKGVLYPIDGSGLYPLGVAWNGLVSVTESPSGAEPTALYADNIKYLTLVSAEEFSCTIEAYTFMRSTLLVHFLANSLEPPSVSSSVRKSEMTLMEISHTNFT